MNRNHYIKKSVISKVLIVILFIVIAFAVYAVTTASAGKTWDAEYPMANARISWQQTFHAGPMGVGR